MECGLQAPCTRPAEAPGWVRGLGGWAHHAHARVGQQLRQVRPAGARVLRGGRRRQYLLLQRLRGRRRMALRRAERRGVWRQTPGG